MQKQAPSLGRILVAVGFTLSCFGLHPLPLDRLRRTDPAEAGELPDHAPTSPRRPRLAHESDVRIGGVSVGKVKELELAPPDQRVNGKDTTAAVIEIEPEFAPISEDARAILRQKTLLGETYVELTSGTDAGPGSGPGLARRRRERLRRGRRLGRVAPGGRHPRRRSDPGGDPDRRDLQRARRGDAELVPALAGERGRSRSTTAASTSTTRSATSARSSPTPPTWSSILERQKVALQGARARHRDHVRGADRARPGARRGDRRLQQHLRGAGVRGRGAGGDVPDPADLPARVAGHARAPGRVPGQHPAADPGPDPGRARPLARRCAGAQALAGPARPVHRPRRACRPSRARGCRRCATSSTASRRCSTASTRSSPT